jgi:hypothetical protein
MMQKFRRHQNSTHYSVILVFSTGHAMRAEKLLKNAGISCKMIPVPRHLSSDCGVSVRIEQQDKKKVLEVFEKNQFDYDAIVDDGR